MPCVKKPLVKKWDRPRTIAKIAASKYEQNEASVKVHWRNVVKELELSYKDDKFWESQSALVRSLVGPVIFRRLTNIFQLPTDVIPYEPLDDEVETTPSELFYSEQFVGESRMHQRYSIMSMGALSEMTIAGTEAEPSEQEMSSLSSTSTLGHSVSKSKTTIKEFSRSSKFHQSKSYTAMSKQILSKSNKSRLGVAIESNGTPNTGDDLVVHHDSFVRRKSIGKKKHKNPHFHMLYCNESETDMIKWKSKYKQKIFEVSASDEFSKKAEILAKKISKEFYDWWVGLGNLEFKSEIKRPLDIEDLFQIWFDEHASRSLVLDPKILPCVLSSIANYVNVPKAACSKVLKRQVAYDIDAETSPAHTMAFNTCLPLRMKHIPPKNNTENAWRSLQIPEDLRSMACVWEDIKHLTSTKAFQQYLVQHPHLPMPPYLNPHQEDKDKKQLFVVPSDFVVTDRSTSSISQELALPVSQFDLELKDVLDKLMNE